MGLFQQTVLAVGFLALTSGSVAQDYNLSGENVTFQLHVLKADLAEDSFGKLDITTAELESAVKESGLKGAFNLIKSEGPVEVIYTGESSTVIGKGADFFLGQDTPFTTTHDLGEGKTSVSSTTVQSGMNARFASLKEDDADGLLFYALKLDLDFTQATNDRLIEKIRTNWNTTLSFAEGHDVEIGRFSRRTADGMTELIIIAELEKDQK